MNDMVSIAENTLIILISINTFTSKISLAILLTVRHTILRMIVQRIWRLIFSQYLVVNIFLYSHHLSALYCIDIVMRNYVLVTHGSLREQSPSLIQRPRQLADTKVVLVLSQGRGGYAVAQILTEIRVSSCKYSHCSGRRDLETFHHCSERDIQIGLYTETK